MPKYKELEDHACRFNDGEQVCDCFDEGFKKAWVDKYDVSEWKKIGKERGYWDYFEKEIREDLIAKFRECVGEDNCEKNGFPNCEYMNRRNEILNKLKDI